MSYAMLNILKTFVVFYQDFKILGKAKYNIQHSLEEMSTMLLLECYSF